MNINLVTQEDFMAFKKELLKEISEVLQGTVYTKQSREWLKTWEVMKMFNMSKGKLQILRNNGSLPFSKIGKCIYFNQADIQKLLDENKIKNSPGPGRGYNRYSMKNRS